MTGFQEVVDGGGGHEARRLRLPDQAHQDRRARRHHPQGGGEGPAPARQRGPPLAPARGRALRRHPHPEPAHAGRAPDGRARGADGLRRADPGRERHGQGAGGAGHPRALAARGPAVRADPLRGPAARGAGVGAVRPRKGRLHRAPSVPSPASSSWPTAARCFSTRSARWSRTARCRLLRVLESRDVLSRRRNPAPARRRAAGGGDQSRPRGGHEAGGVPAGPRTTASTPSPSSSRPCASAARTWPSSPGTSWRPTSPTASSAWAPARSPPSRPTRGRATCASSSTPSSGR